MIITNALGSNYTAEDRKLVLKLLFQPWRWKERKEKEELRTVILAKARTYKNDLNRFRLSGRNNNIQLFMKGRQAIKEALRQIGVKSENEVVVQAFTCVAVVEPILGLGAVPVYADVNGRSLNPSLKNIKKVISNRTKAVILQHTLGYVNPENEEICEWCRENKITVIQDLAHAIGAPAFTAELYKESPSRGRTLLHKQPIVLSFSQDKVFDGISGGALIAPSDQIENIRYKIENREEIFRQLLYPLITYAIRATYDLRIGKIIHFIAKKMGLMNSPIYAPKETVLPNAFAVLALQQFVRLDRIIKHREKIALQYNKLINNKYKIVDKNYVKSGSNLRYPLWVNNRDELENKLQKHNFYLVDHWYDAPVSPKWIEFDKVNYREGLCPNAEDLSKHIFNLPTHANIDIKKANELAKLVNLYGK